MVQIIYMHINTLTSIKRLLSLISAVGITRTLSKVWRWVVFVDKTRIRRESLDESKIILKGFLHVLWEGKGGRERGGWEIIGIGGMFNGDIEREEAGA